MSEKADSTASPAPAANVQRTDLAFVFSLIGGVLITIGSVVGVSYGLMRRPFFWGMGGMMGGFSNFMGGMMGGYYGSNYSSSGFYGIMTSFELVGLVSGILVLIFAILLKSRAADGKTFGIIVLTFSIVSLVSTGGFFIGAIFGIVGGVLALSNA